MALLLSAGLARCETRQFTDVDGRHLEAEIVSATASKVEVKLKSGKTARIDLERLSEDDRNYVKEWLAGMDAEAKERMAKEATARRAAEIPEMITKFCKGKLGKQVGNGECWTLADEAFKACGLKRPGADMRVWGKIVDHQKEKLQPGDIVEFRSARFSDGSYTAPEHTAVVVKGGKRGIVVAEQNWGGNKTVHERPMDLGGLVSGTLIIYRPE